MITVSDAWKTGHPGAGAGALVMRNLTNPAHHARLERWMTECGEERYRLLGGRDQVAQAGDMLMADGRGVISSVLYGPDERTRIGPETRRVLFAVYAPPGIAAPAIARHLEELQAAVRLFA